MNSFDVLSVPWRGINERISGLSGKNIGLLVNSKRTAEPTLKAVEERLRKRFPDTSFSWFYNLKANEVAIATDKKDAFEKWLDELLRLTLADLSVK